ncbi:MAG: glycosyltransferase family 2 protein [Parcubacteria group bacterium]
MDLSIVIVNWNVRDQLARLLNSILKFTSGLEYEVIIVDNQSKDGSVNYLREQFKTEINDKKLIIIDNQFNAGFAKGNNQGLKISQGKYVLFMNPDMELLENSFLILKQFLDNNPAVGVCTCRLLNNDKTIQANVKNDPTLCSQIFVMLKIHHFFSWLPCLNKYFAKDFGYDERCEVKQIMGAFVFARRELLDTIHGWDEDYWLWWEDVEFCIQTRRTGAQIIFLPDTEVIHYESQSFAQQTRALMKQRRFNRGLLTFFRKNHSRPAYLVLYCLQPISMILTIITKLFKIKQRPQSRI